MLTLKAPAKVNLTLEVLGKRSDGYHEVQSIVQTAGLYDTLSFEHAPDIGLTCNFAELQTPDNVALQAARALKQASGYKSGAAIALHKEIPWAAGLGGGSSDAATTLLGLNRLWALGLSASDLAGIGADIGSDVPLFVHGGTCLLEGRGEKTSQLPDIGKTWFVLLKPPMMARAGKTGRLYSLLEPRHYTKGEFTDKMRRYLSSGGKIGHAHLHNVFDAIAPVAYPGIDGYRSLFSCAGAIESHLAGSGPVLFTMMDDENEANKIREALLARDLQAYVVPNVGRGEIGT